MTYCGKQKQIKFVDFKVRMIWVCKIDLNKSKQEFEERSLHLCVYIVCTYKKGLLS